MKDAEYIMVGIVVIIIFILALSGMFFNAKQKCLAQVKDKPAAEIRLICGN